MPGNVNDFDPSEFSGTLPYATELLGVYQPVIGWEGQQGAERVMAESRSVVATVLDALEGDRQIRRTIADAPRPIGPGTLLPRELGSLATSRVLARVHAEVARLGRMPRGAEWTGLLTRLDLPAEVTAAGGSAARPRIALPTGAAPRPTRTRARPARGTSAMATAPAGSGSSADDESTSDVVSESVVAGTLVFLAESAPRVLDGLMAALTRWQRASQFVDPLAGFDPDVARVVLSPVGLLQVYRQYFFELGSFLGSPVEHVWLSPGSTLELFESHTRRTLEDRLVEQGFEAVTQSERETIDQDELSTAIATQNGRNMTFAVGTSAGINFGVVQASATTNLGLGTTQQASQQTAHKQMRQQSERVATEIRRSFKTTFRTSVQTEDTSSRRYVLANTGTDLVNYELRRKMRRVGVQVQHLGTQLCWQVYVNHPGRYLGVSELVHVAAPDDRDAQPPGPEEVVVPEPKETETTVDFQWVSVQGHHPTHDFYRDRGNGRARAGDDDGNTIVNVQTFTAKPPGAGYRLAAVSLIGVEPVDPAKETPRVEARFEPLDEREARAARLVAGQSFRITLRRVNFDHQPAIRFNLQLAWAPTQKAIDAANAAQEAAAATYKQEQRRSQHERYVAAVRDRIRAAGRVARRPSADLRDEERVSIFRRLLARLTDLPEDDRREPHVTSELIRSLFDVDRMLYFVGPDWWRPRLRRPSQQGVGRRVDQTGRPNYVTDRDVVSWGGEGDRDRPNYLVTEDAEPAPLGASLGWLLQLDGDGHRNAFLNAPWVKGVIPIQPGREEAALNWLRLAHIEGTAGLDQAYRGPEPDLAGKSVEEALLILARRVQQQNVSAEAIAVTDRVFENGFDPLASGFRATGTPHEIYDQWVEVLPTDQIVAVEYPLPTNP